MAGDPTPPTLLSYWRELLLLLAAYSVIIGFIFRAVFDRLFMSAYDRCKDNIKARHYEWWKDRMVEFDNTVQLVERRGEQITKLEGMVSDGLDMREQQSNEHHRQSTDAMERITRALTAVQREAQATAEKTQDVIVGVARLEERWDNIEKRWDNIERRIDEDRRVSAERRK